MKTFETEKHNIPEGATHYYCNAAGFGFYSLIRDTWRFWSPYGSCWKFVLDNKPAFEAFPIPQANIETPEENEVEWDGEGLPPVGVECEAVFIEHEHKGYGEFLILGYYGDYVWMEYIGELSNKSKHYTAKVDMVKFLKPESESSLCSAEPPRQLEECEWNNGDVVFIGNNEVGKFIGLNPIDSGVGFVYSARDGRASSYHLYHLSPQSLKDRQRADAIYDMCASVDNFTEESNFWAGEFYDAGYRKKCTLDKQKS